MKPGIFDYGFSIRGKSHIRRGIECQDSFAVRRLENGWYVGAVADGVGSCKNAARGASLAADAAVRFVCEYMPYDYSLISIKSMLRTAMNHAWKTVLRQTDEENPPESFDTTLSLVIYDGKRIVYAHSGDGAIIGLTVFGELVEITSRQKGEDGSSVIPLRGGYTRWEIDHYEEDLAGVILVTDGMLEALSPYLLKLNPDGTEKPTAGLYVPLASWLADPAGLPEEEENRQILREQMEVYLTAEDDVDPDLYYSRAKSVCAVRAWEEADGILEELRERGYGEILVHSIQDDKTAVGFLNPDLQVDSQPAAYYREPDWEALQEAWRRKAYPSLYDDSRTAEAEEAGAKEKIVKWMKKWTKLDSEVNENDGAAEDIS